jgi:uncharacterized RDD family membrane protein YckC
VVCGTERVLVVCGTERVRVGLLSVGSLRGFASIALTADRQRFGDVTAATVVVRTEE